MAQHNPILAGKKALVVGIANEHSIAYGCASAFRRFTTSAHRASSAERSK